MISPPHLKQDTAADPGPHQAGYQHIFHPLPCPCLKNLAAMASEVKIPRRTIVYRAGDPAKAVFLIGEGLITLSSLFREGRELGQVILSQGNLFGEQEIISRTPRFYQASALTDCTIAKINRADFIRIMQDKPEFSFFVAQVMSSRLYRSELRLDYFSYHTISQRLARLLIELVQTVGHEDKTGMVISPSPTHRELATLLVSTRETISLVMGEFRRDKLIAFDRQRLYILDKNRLAEYGK